MIDKLLPWIANIIHTNSYFLGTLSILLRIDCQCLTYRSLISCGILLSEGNWDIRLAWIQIRLGHGYELSWLLRCNLLNVVHKWFHWFSPFLFLRCIHVTLENSIGGCWSVSIWIFWFSHSNVTHLAADLSRITDNLIMIYITLPLISISYLVRQSAISKWGHLVLYVISKLRPRPSSTWNQIVLLILLIVIYNCIMHSLLICWHYNNSFFWFI